MNATNVSLTAHRIARDEVARRVRAARSYARLTIGQLAEQVGVGTQTVKRIECGQRDARRHELWAIAEVCGLPRGFFEMDFDRFFESGETMSATLAGIDRRLARVERRLGA